MFLNIKASYDANTETIGLQGLESVMKSLIL